MKSCLINNMDGLLKIHKRTGSTKSQKGKNVSDAFVLGILIQLQFINRYTKFFLGHSLVKNFLSCNDISEETKKKIAKI